MNKTDSILPPPPPPPYKHNRHAHPAPLFLNKLLSTSFNLMRGTLGWNEKGIKRLFDLMLRMVYVQGFGL